MYIGNHVLKDNLVYNTMKKYSDVRYKPSSNNTLAKYEAMGALVGVVFQF